ncbi:MAG: hypothetical protein HQ515_12950 [Phycisphaeraceae bacterium]|nr:hypothetical protein [Phycisphaeraceae bacterium]
MQCYLKLLNYFYPFPRVPRFTVEVRDYDCLKTALGWAHDPVLEHDYLREYAGPADSNGSQDAEFAFTDTVKILRRCREASLLIWHDFSPNMIMDSQSKASVCAGIERLLRKHVIRAPIYHLQDSRVGIMQVPAQYAGIRD